tara:strand:- start:1207 stop:2847 length:1641 start_codon:yes stop_codon:yes gene_type:complete
MSLFERLNNKRYDLQEKKEFPGDKSGAYKAAKIDIEVKKGLKDAGASGDFSPTMSTAARKKAQAVRDARIKRLATPDPFDDDYVKKTGKVDKRTKVGKKIGSAFETPKKPTTTAAPGSFGKGDTTGQMNVKAMDKKAFVKTPYAEYDQIKQPRGVKIPGKTYKNFRGGTRNISSMNPSEMQRAFGTSSTEGSAGVSGSTKTQGVNQSDVSKKIAKDNKAYNINRKKKISVSDSQKKTFSAFKKQADSASGKLVSKREVVRSAPGTKDVEKLRDINKQIKSTERISKGYDLASKGKGTKGVTPIVKASDLKTVTDNTPKLTTSTSKPKRGYDLFKPDPEADKLRRKIEKSSELKNLTKKKGQEQLIKKISTAEPKATKKISKILGGSSNVDFYKSGSKLAKGISKVSPKAGKLALGATKTLAKLGTPGRIAATVGTVATLSPAARKGISGLAKQALAGAGLGGVVGASAAVQKKSDEERIKKNLPAKFVKDKDGKEIKTVTRMNMNLSDYSKKTKKLKPRTSTSLKGSAEYAGKVKNIPAYGAKYTG